VLIKSFNQVRRLTGPRPPQATPSPLSQITRHHNQTIISRWIKKAGVSADQNIRDIEDCLKDLNSLDLEEKDNLSFVLRSLQMKDWLTTMKSQILVVDAETPPNELTNPISSSAAFLINSLRTSGVCLVISYMCGLRSRDAATSTPVSMVISLVAQILRHISTSTTSADEMDVAKLLGDKSSSRASRATMTGATDLLGRLIESLPADLPVFVVLDSTANLGDPAATMTDTAHAVKNLVDTVACRHPSVKILVTLPSPPLLTLIGQEGRWPMLYVPDHVDGGKQGLNLEMLQEDTRIAMGKTGSSRGRDVTDEDEGSEDGRFRFSSDSSDYD
jgi:hypothetical protein